MYAKDVSRRAFLKATGAAVAAMAAGTPESEALAAPGEVGDPPEPFAAAPAVFRPTASGCTLHWVPNGEVETSIFAGQSADALVPYWEAISANATEVELTGFPADSPLYYQCFFRKRGEADRRALPLRRVQTARRPGSSFQVALIADSHVNRVQQKPAGRANLDKAINMVLADAPDYVIFLGDEPCTKEHGADVPTATFESTMDKWRFWRTAYGPLLAAVPSFLVLGNHEGEAGYQRVWRDRGEYLQRWSTIARKRFQLNPLPYTYPEGGENDGWLGDPADPATGGADEGNCSPLQNYFAWTWGDALFVVLDVHRYTNIGGEPPVVPESWTLGRAQMRWFESVLTNSRARWKLVLAHHLAGGLGWGVMDGRRTAHAYGRGGAKYARIGEQAKITEIMKRTGAQFFMYGHDHVFAHQQAEGIHFLLTGRPTGLSPGWWDSPDWVEAYGTAAARDPYDFYAALGYTRLNISPEKLTVEFVRSGTHGRNIENITQREGEVFHRFVVT